MTIYIVLTVAGSDTGPFNLYSDVDGFISAFEVGVPKVYLELGYNSYSAPDGTTVVRVMSDGICKNYIDIPITVGPIPTTTSTSTTETPDPPFPTDCYCFNLTAVGEYTILWSDCAGDTHSFIGSNFDINICAQLGSIAEFGGDGSLIISNSGNLCTLNSDCSPTTTTTTTLAPECYCYNVTSVGFYVVEWFDCQGVKQTWTGPNIDINICAQLGTISYSTGDGSLTITGGINPCTTNEDCFVTTTTTSSSSTTTTTSSSSTTTTSTTTGIPSYLFELVYDDTSCANACAGLVTTTYYSADIILGAASVLYTDSGLTIPAVNGYYSNFSDCFTVIDGLGTIDSVSSCSL